MTQQQRSTDTIEAVMSAARDQFAQHGYTATSVDAIAASCNRTKGTVYHHFPSKEDLFERVFIAEQRRIASALAIDQQTEDAVAQLQVGLSGYLHIIASEPDTARITLIDAPVVMGWQRWRNCDDGPFRGLLVALFTAIDESGRLGPGHTPAIVAELVLGATTELALTLAANAAGRQDASAFGQALHQLVTDVTVPET